MVNICEFTYSNNKKNKKNKLFSKKIIFTSICHGADHVQSVSHAVGKQSSILLTAKVEPPNLSGISPLVEVGCGLVVFESSDDGTVDNHL